MKDILIPARLLRRELYWLLGCFLLAVATNTFAIIKFTRPWSEQFTQLHRVLLLAFVFWLLLAALRALFSLLFTRRKNHSNTKS